MQVIQSLIRFPAIPRAQASASLRVMHCSLPQGVARWMVVFPADNPIPTIRFARRKPKIETGKWKLGHFLFSIFHFPFLQHLRQHQSARVWKLHPADSLELLESAPEAC
jgi:hypothetical protein